MSRQTARRASRGFSLIELMIVVVVGLVITLAVTILLTRSEATRLSSTALNDAGQSGAYATFILDRAVRSAGSGFAGANRAFGCQLLASRDGNKILPRGALTLPEPFASVSDIPVHLAPVVIHKDAMDFGGGRRSDVIAVMTGSSGKAEAGYFIMATEVGQVMTITTLGFRPNDLVLLAHAPSTVGLPPQPCMITQVAATFNNGPNDTNAAIPLTLGGTYYSAAIDGNDITAFNINSAAYALGNAGNAASSSRPQFLLYGVDAQGVLYSHDILNSTGIVQSLPIADGVYVLRAVYGIDINGDNKVDQWIDPKAGSGYESTTLMSDLGIPLLQNIISVRIGAVMRSSLRERSEVGPSSLTLFQDLGLPEVIPIDDRHFRYRAFEVSVPVRNMM
jgi:type IV pilus assembly protein PilW